MSNARSPEQGRLGSSLSTLDVVELARIAREVENAGVVGAVLTVLGNFFVFVASFVAHNSYCLERGSRLVAKASPMCKALEVLAGGSGCIIGSVVLPVLIAGIFGYEGGKALRIMLKARKWGVPPGELANALRTKVNYRGLFF